LDGGQQHFTKGVRVRTPFYLELIKRILLIHFIIQIMAKGYNHTTMCQELSVKECEWREHFENRKAILSPELIEEMLRL